MAKKHFYVVKTSEGAKVYDSCEKARAAYEHRSNAIWKGFATREEALTWIGDNATSKTTSKATRATPRAKSAAASAKSRRAANAVYCDSGNSLQTGRPTEIRVTNGSGISLLALVLPANQLNERGNYLPGKGKSNNYGELKGLGLAIEVARIIGATQVCTDSETVYLHWSRDNVKPKVDPETRALAHEVSEARRRFEAEGGSVIKIGGGENPADLGYHRN